jgi:CheY-like chemotaxis protein
MDIEMPGKDGFQTTKAIREMQAGAEIYIIGCSGHDEEAEKKKCFNAGMNEYLTKPVNKTRLLNIIENVLKLKENENENEN